MPARKGLAEDQRPYDRQTDELLSVPHARLKIDKAGRVVIPAEMRAAMGVSVGDVLVARVVDGEFRLMSRQAGVRRAQQLVRQHVPEGTKLVDELLAERRAEAKSEGG